MKNWIRRFALLAVMGSLVGGIVMAGCSSPDQADDTTAPADANGAAPAPEDNGAAPAPDANGEAPAPADAPPAE